MMILSMTRAPTWIPGSGRGSTQSMGFMAIASFNVQVSLKTFQANKLVLAFVGLKALLH